jgi:hypothetical protein
VIRQNAKIGFYATISPESKPYAASLAAAAATTTYLDFSPGEYDCWVDGAVAGDVLQVAYLPIDNSPPTIAPWALPTAASSAQASGVPTGASGAAILPADRSQLRIPIFAGYRCAVVFTGAAAQLNAVQVL